MDIFPAVPPNLRDKAEVLLAMDGDTVVRALPAVADPVQMGHELRVHQIELEMQNEELHRALGELEVSRTRYFDLFDMAPLGYITLGETGQVLEANFAASSMLGVPRKPLVGQLFTRFIDVSGQDGYYLFRKRVLETDGLQSCEIRMVADNRMAFWAQLDATVDRTGAGSLVTRITLTNVSERKRIEDDLRISAAAFESIAGMFVTDANKEIQRVNAAFTAITGYSAEEVMGQDPRFLKSGRHDEAFYTHIWSDVAAYGGWQGEIWNRRRTGEIYPEWLSIAAVKNNQGAITHYIGSFTDISAHKSAEDEIRSLAFFDPLTQLPNRRLLMERLETAMSLATRHKRQGALLFVDLDDFKTLNDTQGHDMGDVLLQQAAQRLNLCTREGDTVARLGGDEFVVLLENLGETTLEAATQAEAVAGKVLDALAQNYWLGGLMHHSSASVGVTLFGPHAERMDEPLKRADLAMYQAKAGGRNTVCFFDPHTQALVRDRAEMEAGLRQALESQQLELHYQIQVVGHPPECKSEATGVEALVRWRHPVKGMVPPGDFIPLAEETGLILRLGRWVLETACAQMVLWSASPSLARLSMSVNVSARQISQRDFVAQVLSTLAKTGANPHLLKLELTESVLVTNVEDVIHKMVELKAHGVDFSLDDFGTGYSSLSYLKRLPIYQLKIDQSFIKDLLTDPNDEGIAKMVIALATSLGLSVIAEGVESSAHCDRLAAMGCHAYQGYFFGRPMPGEQLEACMV